MMALLLVALLLPGRRLGAGSEESGRGGEEGCRYQVRDGWRDPGCAGR